MGELGEIVRSYYAALNAGNSDAVVGHFHEQAQHYYSSLEPTEGAQRIADLAVLAHRAIEGRYYIEDLVEDDNQVSIEWTMTWRDPGSGELKLVRGAEFYRFMDGRIIEVRSYSASRPGNLTGDLIGFDHAGRGYMMLDGK